MRSSIRRELGVLLTGFTGAVVAALVAPGFLAGGPAPVDPFMGDWQGSFKPRRGKPEPLVAQVIPMGDGWYHANFLPAFDRRVEPIASLEGHVVESAVQFRGWGDVSAYRGPDWVGAIGGGKFTGKVPGREGGTFELTKVVRLSPTLGAEPPGGAEVLFDGTSFENWKLARGKGDIGWKLAGGAMVVVPGSPGIASKRTFTYGTIHLEFRTPYKPKAREQGRGNSGVSAHGREVQVLDTYGLKGRDKECGAIYNRHQPLVNMCAPPLQWQTYDITYEPAPDGKSARMTVRHNGVVIHESLTFGGPLKPTALRLQEHGSAVAYRNIWLVEPSAAR
jgi:hypothetical protein